jgi:transposase
MQENLENLTKKELIQTIFSLKEATEISEISYNQNIISLENKLVQAISQLDWFKRQYFGSKSERLIPQDSDQLSLFAVPPTPPKESVTVKAFERQVRRNKTELSDENILRFDESVPVVEHVIFPKEVEGLAETEYEVIGEKVTTRLKQIPCSYSVERTIRKTVKIKSTKTLHTAPAPDAIIERSFADVSLLSGLIVDKFQYHLPLYRQHQRMSNSGVNVSRSNITNLVHRTLELLEPVYLSILSGICSSEIIAMDETPIKAGRKVAGKMQTAYFWPVMAEDDVAFIYSNSRSSNVIKENIGKSCKVLLSDGYSAYEKFIADNSQIEHAQCWAHARRKFFEAQDHSPKESQKALDLIRMLFKVEEEITNQETEEQILQKRRTLSLPVIEELFLYLHKLWFEELIDKDSLLGKAVFYAKEREKGLRCYLDNPGVDISNNKIENMIRPIAIGRKNWLFCWSEIGAKYSAIAYTLIQNCKLHKVNSWDYLNDVLVRIDSHPARDVNLLTPKNWKQKFQKNNYGI